MVDGPKRYPIEFVGEQAHIGSEVFDIVEVTTDSALFTDHVNRRQALAVRVVLERHF